MNKKLWTIAGAAVLTVILLVIAVIFGVDWTTTVGICYRDGTDPVGASARSALEQRLMEQGYEVFVTDASADQSLQNKMIGHMQQQGCDVLIVEPVLSAAGQELTETIAATNLPCVLINRQLEMEHSYPYVGIDPTQPGSLQGQMVMDLPDGGDINGDGTVCYMIIQGPDGHWNTEQQTRSFETALEMGELETQLLSIDSGDWSEESGRSICSRELATYGRDIEVIICGNDAMAAGAAEAIRNGGWQVGEHVYLFGIGGDSAALTRIREDSQTGTVLCDADIFAQKVTETVGACIAGKRPDPQFVDCTAITKQNVDG